ncbi:M35 family metallo-endopeptidase [Yoonia litorea]|uniref:Lysine-specific metallo-endopeptidase n=1 Tax=Yoonia litorea TaxID=1123755 RepID=A0A1I6M744_9RHOB|nr:M35 family metallo-endopeptidase [Yoonia litorea]SFS11443.1 Lysine-specific metallo-endopeptidase [Yoonia litorea]
MRVGLVLALLIGLSASPAVADTFRGCTPAETTAIEMSLNAAKQMVVKAGASVRDDDDYQRWFGAYSERRAEHVRASLKSIVAALRRGRVTAQCDQISPDGCGVGEYAFVYSDQPYRMHLCPSFFDLPRMAQLRPGSRRSDFGTQEGTLIHEISHFVTVARTEDHCYSRSECRIMALDDPNLAIENADSYQYYAEDITFYARQPVADKPPPAPRPRR